MFISFLYFSRIFDELVHQWMTHYFSWVLSIYKYIFNLLLFVNLPSLYLQLIKNRIIYFKIFIIWKKFTDFHQSGEKSKVRGKQGNLLMVCHQSIKRIDCILSEAEIAFFDALILRNVCECLPTRLTIMASSLINESGKNPIPFLLQKRPSIYAWNKF